MTGGAVRITVKSSTIGLPGVSGTANRYTGKDVPLEPGQPFNPYGLFHGVFIPEALVRWPKLSPGAKIAYGRLARYAGQDGSCHPRQETLAREIGVSERQIRNYLTELTTHRLLKVVQRGLHAPNDYVFLWHDVFTGSNRKYPSAQDRKDISGQERKEASGHEWKEASGPLSRESVQESPFKESPASSSDTRKTPPPTPSSIPTMATTGNPAQSKADDDDAGAAPEYMSEQDELTVLIERATGKPPDRKLIADILDRLQLREMPLRAYLDDIRSRLPRLKRRAGPGFFYTVAAQPDLTNSAATDEKARVPQRCSGCSGTGKTPDNSYCSSCQMGRDLERVERRSPRKRAAR
jgi:hypothetical protein